MKALQSFTSNTKRNTAREDHKRGQELCNDLKYEGAEEYFREAVQAREKVLGKAHKDTIDSKSWLGCALYEQHKYQEAEELLQEAIRGQEELLGKEHYDTCRSKFWLARTLYKKQKYQEAEELLREAWGDFDNRRSWLADTLYKQGKYQGAEELYRAAVRVDENIYGKKASTTLNKQYWLARTLYQQQKYQAAEELLRKTVQVQETVRGKNDKDTLFSKFRLALTLYQQHKYQEAEEVQREVVQGQEKAYGKEYDITLYSKCWLAVTLEGVQKYPEAKQLLEEVKQGRPNVSGTDDDDPNALPMRRLVDYVLENEPNEEELLQEAELEKVFGREHTLRCKYWLGYARDMQQKYQEAEEVLQKVVAEQEEVLGKDHPHTLDSRRLLQKVLVAARPSTPTNDTQTTLTNHLSARSPEAKGNRTTSAPTNDAQTTIIHRLSASLAEAKANQTTLAPTNDTETSLTNRLSSFFPEAKGSRTTYSDLEVYEISSLLKHLNERWSKVPRTYIVLRTIGYLHLLNQFIDLGFSDYWFPVTTYSLPDSLSPNLCSKFVAAQDLVLSKSMDLEKSEEGSHHYFKRDEPLPFERKGILGSGGFGQVDRVLSLISFREYARKRVPRNTAFGGGGKEAIKCFIAEIEVLKRLKHDHVVEFVGSYTDPKFLGLIMSPVAEMDLSTYLKDADISKHRELRTFFGCLARALEFLHGQNVRHKDIKPGNILVDHGNVLFTDFGLAFDFTEATRSTTLGMVNGMTPRYCAPEVAVHEPRNTSSDIWSLGVVFLEMLVVLKGETINYMDMYFQSNGSKEPLIYKNLVALAGLIADLEGKGSESDNKALGWIKDMLQVDRQLRPTAASLVTSITAFDANGEQNTSFCGLCCFSPEDDVSDGPDELEDDDF